MTYGRWVRAGQGNALAQCMHHLARSSALDEVEKKYENEDVALGFKPRGHSLRSFRLPHRSKE